MSSFLAATLATFAQPTPFKRRPSRKNRSTAGLAKLWIAIAGIVPWRGIPSQGMRSIPDDQAGTCRASPDWYTRQEVIPPGDCHGNEPGRLRAGAGRSEGRTHLLPGAGLCQAAFPSGRYELERPPAYPTLMGS